ncbi:hypothetical protein HYH02_001858 [Chlamydomonas schloesseri]|uniref:Uncharacterized protein n=1 Tax=Chlamydomonas schloesseri TaxID=2026947 RepID=A0A835WWD4_9CHLO|nr:hypothetical protein HYH02_001858 [Chlamydomonas schloesseri]|eukprot:KAG2453645.1 hypothetical protein HYH02_001858 [Chlamydomonas schloesseri]
MSTWPDLGFRRRDTGTNSLTHLDLVAASPVPGMRSASATQDHAMDLGSPPAAPGGNAAAAAATACGGLRPGQLYGAGGLPVARPLFGAAPSREEIEAFFVAAEQKLATRRTLGRNAQ